MAVDMLRSFHSVPVWFDANQTIRANIRWYPCRESAKSLPIPSAFGSAVWEAHPDDWTKGPGVEAGPLAWRRSRYPAPKGDHFHGEAEWYLNGVPASLVGEPGELANGGKECHPIELSVQTFAGPDAVAFVSQRIEASVQTFAWPATDEVDVSP